MFKDKKTIIQLYCCNVCLPLQAPLKMWGFLLFSLKSKKNKQNLDEHSSRWIHGREQTVKESLEQGREVFLPWVATAAALAMEGWCNFSQNNIPYKPVISKLHSIWKTMLLTSHVKFYKRRWLLSSRQILENSNLILPLHCLFSAHPTRKISSGL